LQRPAKPQVCRYCRNDMRDLETCPVKYHPGKHIQADCFENDPDCCCNVCLPAYARCCGCEHTDSECIQMYFFVQLFWFMCPVA